MKKQIIDTDQAPKAIGTYSQAVKCNQTVYISGQLPMSPKTMAIIDADLEQQIEQIFDNIEAIALAAGGVLADIVKLTVFLLDMADFPHLNAVMEKRFCAPYPARAAVAVKALPKDARIEIEAIMVCSETA